MPTKNPRINITFEEATVSILSELAQLEHKSLSGLAKELILERWTEEKIEFYRLLQKFVIIVHQTQ